jgi:MFS family permease
MDSMLYSFVIPALLVIWHLTPAEAGTIGTAALLTSAAGGWLAGILADRVGRVRVLQVTIAWFAVFTFLSGFCNSYWQLLTLRGLEGLGFGGEWAVGSVLIGEAIAAQHRGKAVGVVQSGWAVGWGIAAISYVVFFKLASADEAWRMMFWIGILPALLVLFIRRRVPEPEVFSRHAANRDAERENFLTIFSPALLRTTVLASLMVVGAQGGYYAITTWLPTYLKNVRGLSVLGTGIYLSVIILGSFAGYLVSAYLADAIGRKRTLTLYAVASLAAVLAFTLLPISNRAMLVVGFPLGFFASGTFSPIGAFLTELFPTSVRASGQGFSYNAGRAVGALFPALVGVIGAHASLEKAICGFAAAAYLLLLAGLWRLPETAGMELVSEVKSVGKK